MSERLSSSVTVRGRFHRSVQLRHDFERIAKGQSEADTYILTPTAADLATQICDGLLRSGGERAWTIIGPFGGGKSAFTLHLANVLTRCIRAKDTRLRASVEKLPPFQVLPLVGERRPLREALSAALSDAVGKDRAAKIQRLCKTGIDGVVEACRIAVEASPGGLMLAIDEFGKFVEHAARDPEGDDVYLIQALAEFAARCEQPFLLLTVQHASLTQYLPADDVVRRNEWAKVQGRLREVTFLEPPEQMLRLVDAAIEVPDNKLRRQLQTAAKQAGEVANLAATLDGTGHAGLLKRLPRCVPLHPLTTLLLWPAFRSDLAQNERSLFAFLTTAEPHGLRQFLRSRRVDATLRELLYPPSELFDHLTESLGGGLMRGSTGRRWAEAQRALDRVGTAEPLAAAAIKVVALLTAYGGKLGLSANVETIASAISRSPEDARCLLTSLRKRSIVVWRRHLGAFALWDGSDADVEAIFDAEREKAERPALCELLQQHVRPRPIVARAHYFKTGTPRQFSVRVIAAAEVSEVGDTAAGAVEGHDGEVIFVLSSDNAERRRVKARVKDDAADGRPRIWAIPTPSVGIEHDLLDLDTWERLQAERPEVNEDAVARREVAARLAAARERVGAKVGSLLGLHGHRFDPTLCDWYAAGEKRTVQSPAAFQRLLTQLCDGVYPKAPVLRNELVNRDRLSSAAAAARNTLLRRLAGGGSDALDFEGHPPEATIYAAMFGASELGRSPARGKAKRGTWSGPWQCVDKFLDETAAGPLPLEELYRRLAEPPIGMRRGPMPLLVLAVLLASGGEVALYDRDGRFLPDLRDEVIELFARNPDDFAVRRFRPTREQEAILLGLRDAVTRSDLTEASNGGTKVMDALRPLLADVATLPRYARYTKRLSPVASRLRDAVLRARDPADLLAEDLPTALDATDASSSILLDRLADAVRALRAAYPKLLEEVGAETLRVFDASEGPQRLAARAEQVAPYVADGPLALLVRELPRLMKEAGGEDWRSGVGRVLQKGLPPDRWTDRDHEEFRVRLCTTAAEFLRLEELVVRGRGHGADEVLVRVALLNGSFEEKSQVWKAAGLTPEKLVEHANTTNKLLRNVDETVDRKQRIAILAKALLFELEIGEDRDP